MGYSDWDYLSRVSCWFRLLASTIKKYSLSAFIVLFKYDFFHY
jgi:hypothetical protein